MRFHSISTDTRTLEAGSLFVALAGDRFDAHDFLEDAARAGATGAVVRQGTRSVKGLVLFEVPDTLRALGQLARARRDDISGPVVAVTGTNGKTSTRQLIAAVLRTAFRVHATRGNLNNLVGVPLTILGAPADTEALVVEAGASVPGESARLREIIHPTMAVITNVAAGHLEGFGTVEAVLEEKIALLKGVPVAIVGPEPPVLAERARALARRVVVAGVRTSADVQPGRWWLDESGHATLEIGGQVIRLPLIGAHQAGNAMLALAVARELQLDFVAATRALGQVDLPSGRGQVLHSGRLTVINDAYNANPGSLSAALDTVRVMRGGRRLAVLVGTMLELGGESRVQHERMADAIVAAEPDLIGAVGEFAEVLQRRASALGDRLVTAADPEELGKRVASRLQGDELILVKASRGVQLERAIPFFLPAT
ncbi:MAG: UDP-N-acetylmuramoyl-tripeptide--D-alanyl-D-alanine ligase [Gemmatimonadetes bacterium]|nr:UDP-N-acetylmuramoyl-tripeptide--D-alanyl-D-alanine ligase [Gemmatimonadota bacterium]